MYSSEAIWEMTQIERSMVIDAEDDSLKEIQDATALWPGFFGGNYSHSRILMVAHYPAAGPHHMKYQQ